ncbi:MAG: FkbM family methyltransferase [Methylocella sp.]
MQRVDSGMMKIHKAYENLNYDIRTNGEWSTLAKLSRSGNVTTVFDVGANHGDWADLATKAFPTAEIHAFEIVPETFARLQGRFGNAQNIILNEIGLSDSEGALDVYFSPKRHLLATCVAGFSEAFHKYKPETRVASATTGDRYCAERGIESIDVLKIDVEGFEPQVLRGFQGMLSRARIDVIQFEYGYINIDTHFLLKDFYDYLLQFKMQLGKIYPDYVDFRPYQHADEDFFGPNYLAVRSDRQDLTQVLGQH